MSRVCATCPKPISRGNKRGYCIKCLANLPEEREKRRRYAGDRWNNPMFRARMSVKLSAGAKRRAADPVKGAKMREIGKERAKHLLSPEVFAKSQRPEARAAAGAKTREFWLGWCPQEYRARYKYLTANMKIRAAEARRMVEDEIKADQRRKLAAMSPFERQMHALQNGATLYEAAPRATLDRPGVYRS